MARAHRSDDGLVLGADGKWRCWWAAGAPDYAAYHDTEWGFPVHDDRRLFEKLCLEGFQAGLSWLTILRRREAFRRAFAGFDFHRVARFTTRDVSRLLRDPSIIRHRGKIESVVNNARRALELVGEHGSIAAYVRRFEPAPGPRPRTLTRAALAALTPSPEARAMAKDLRRRGWTFVGPTTVYAFMQAMGLVNDHLEGCWVREKVERARRAARRLSAAPRC
ncbi:MAG TPA: DNA-3-methyladenine glycosylase I [Vicinamibacterales bacterium]|nr:DNA-3-methyladenine glycosylase I [Vicinamibacterales bacterium]